MPVFKGKTKVADLTADFNLQVYGVKKLSYDPSTATSIDIDNSNKNKAILYFNDGKSAYVTNLKIYSHYYSTEGYLIGGETRHMYKTSFGVGGGAATAILNFNQIDNIVFHPVENKSFAKH